MSTPIRRELELGRIAARARQLRLVMHVMSARQAESRPTGGQTPAGLDQSIADLGEQLGDVHRRQAEPESIREPAWLSARGRTRRFSRDPLDFVPEGRPASGPRART